MRTVLAEATCILILYRSCHLTKIINHPETRMSPIWSLFTAGYAIFGGVIAQVRSFPAFFFIDLTRDAVIMLLPMIAFPSPF